MTQRELFPAVPDDVQKRVCAAFANPATSECAKAVLERLQFAPGRANAISIESLRSWWRMHPNATIWGDRSIKAAVKELLEERGVPVGSARSGSCGYFLLVTPEDIDQAEKPFIAEVISLARRLRAINHRSELSRVICGQMGLSE